MHSSTPCSAAASRESGPMSPMESQGWRKKSTVTVLYSYSYPVSNSTHNSDSHDGGNEVSMREGERLILLEKSNMDWLQVRRPGDKSQPFYAPANYLQEDGISKAKKSVPSSPSSNTGSFMASKSGHIAVNPSGHNKSNANRRHIGVSSSTSASIAHLNETSRSDDCLHSPSISIRQQQSDLKSASGGGGSSKWSIRQVANSELRKQRSTSMDAIMFLELLENEIKDMPGGSGANSGGDVNKRSGHKGSGHKNKYGMEESAHNRSSSSIGRQLKSESLVDRFKKPRISKDLWERRKSWAVEESTPPPTTTLDGPTPSCQRRGDGQYKLGQTSSTLDAVAIGRSTAAAKSFSPTGESVESWSIRQQQPDVNAIQMRPIVDPMPALPAKKNPSQQGVAVSASPPVRLPKVDNYSRVIPLQSAVPSPGSPRNNKSNSVVQCNQQQQFIATAVHFFSDSQSRLIGIAGEVGSADSDAPVPHPIPPPRRSSSESMERSAGIMGQSASSSSPPRLPPKNAKLPAAKPPTPTTTPKQQQQQETSSTQKYEIITQSCHECSTPNQKKEVKDNYVNLMRPLTMVDTLDDIQSDESGIYMSFDNPLFNEKEVI
uniref:SH3 domain-containing protein n=1 Tax=Daphnia galeata TaxID=27404 RepID=A0A8J2W4G5_9CRUS|nr:unnamed protein product [Daphnia galeata]